MYPDSLIDLAIEGLASQPDETLLSIALTTGAVAGVTLSYRDASRALGMPDYVTQWGHIQRKLKKGLLA